MLIAMAMAMALGKGHSLSLPLKKNCYQPSKSTENDMVAWIFHSSTLPFGDKQRKGNFLINKYEQEQSN